MTVTHWLLTSRSLLCTVRRAAGDTEPRDDDAKIKPAGGAAGPRDVMYLRSSEKQHLFAGKPPVRIWKIARYLIQNIKFKPLCFLFPSDWPHLKSICKTKTASINTKVPSNALTFNSFLKKKTSLPQ